MTVQVDGLLWPRGPGRCVHSCHAWLGLLPLSLQPGPLLSTARLSPGTSLAPGVMCLCGLLCSLGACSESERRTEEYDAQVRGGCGVPPLQARAWLWPPGGGLALGGTCPFLAANPRKLPASDPEGHWGSEVPVLWAPAPRPVLVGRRLPPVGTRGAVSRPVLRCPLPHGFRVGSHVPSAGILCLAPRAPAASQSSSGFAKPRIALMGRWPQQGAWSLSSEPCWTSGALSAPG